MAVGVRGVALRAGLVVVGAGVVLLLLLVWEARAAHADTGSDGASESPVDVTSASFVLGGAESASGVTVKTATVAPRPVTPTPRAPTPSSEATGAEAAGSSVPPVVMLPRVLTTPPDAASSPGGERASTINVPRAGDQLPGPPGKATGPRDASAHQLPAQGDAASPRPADGRGVAARASPVARVPSHPRTYATAKDRPVRTLPATDVTTIPVLDAPHAPSAPEPIGAATQAGPGSTSDLAPAPASDSRPLAAVLVAAVVVLALAGRRRIARARVWLAAPAPIPLIRPG